MSYKNMKWFAVFALALVLVVIASTAQSVLAQPNEQAPQVEVSANVHHDVSGPIGNQPSSPSARNLTERPLRILGVHGASNAENDPVVQSQAGPVVNVAGALSFDGIGDTSNTPSNPCNCAPPDTNGAVGATQYVQWVNTAFAVYDKTTGAILAGYPKAGNALWAGFGGACETNNDGDPIVQYDKAAGRWIMTQFSVSTLPYLQCVAVSTTSDATGTYNRYSFSYGSQFNDYPKLGVWPDGYYISYNIFNNGQTFAGSKVCAFDRTAMLAGASANQQCYQLSTAYGGLLPSDLDGSTAPPTGSPNFFMNFANNSLNLWKFHVDWTNSANSTLTGPTNIPVAAFNTACSGGGNCIPQPNTRQQLDSLADRLMYRLAYRNRAGVESLVVNHSVAISGNKHSSVTGVRWYELRNPSGNTMANGTPVVYQQGTYSPDSTSRWMGSIAMDKNGDIALGYSASSSSVLPSLRYTGRAATDALNTMGAETIVKPGGGSQLPNLSRWGDYSAMTVDPVDDCTFWFTSEYLKSSGTFNWSTWIVSFKFSSCI